MRKNMAIGQLVRRSGSRILNGLSMKPLHKARQSPRPATKAAPPTRALAWIAANRLPGGGIRVGSGHPNAYPEVTGYIVCTLLTCGERALAADLVRWLICTQRADGSVVDPDLAESYVFDTGQVLRGLLASVNLVDGAAPAARRAADFLCRQMIDGGQGGYPPRYAGTCCPEAAHLYVLPPLVEAAEALGEPAYRQAAEACLAYYIRSADFLGADDLTHFLAYQLEALIDLGRADLAQPVLDRLRDQQRADGAVRGKGGVRWVCMPGLAQLAICWYKGGQWQPADAAMTWLEAHQQPDGGFLGSYGPGAAYMAKTEISWAVKFYLDAHLLRVGAFFDREADVFPTDVSPRDGRLEFILRQVTPGAKVLEAGCGKGRFLKAIREAHPDVACTGVDPSAALQSCLPGGIAGSAGSLEDIPAPADTYDVVFAVEAIEHSIDPERAVAEMVRVAKPGGAVIIIDKQQAAWGRLPCPPWERWPEAGDLKELLHRGCDAVRADPVGYDDKPASDGLMLAWSGRKRSPLTGAQWNHVLITPQFEQTILDAVRFNRLLPWAREVLGATRPGEKVLEIGSGTGQISLQLAAAGRQVTCLDFSSESLDFVRGCAEKLHVEITCVRGDATAPLPVEADGFDCVWSSGLLEHFDAAVRRTILTHCARACRGRVLALVPNAACLTYRLGKAQSEAAGTWPYGLETPLMSLADDFRAAGLEVLREYSVGGEHALEFLPRQGPLRPALAEALRRHTESELTGWNQGYILITEGVVPADPRMEAET